MHVEPKKDYYEVLEVPRDADAKTIKRAFLKKARTLYPDVNKAPDAEERFKEVNEAYAVLSDDQKRANYDRYGDPNGPMGFGSDYVDVSDIFGGSGFGFVFYCHVCIEASGAAHVEFAFGFGVEVQQYLALEQSGFQTECTVHSGLLGGGEEGFDVAVGQRFVLKYGEYRRNAYAVIGTECRAVGRNPLAVDVCLDGVGGEVEDLVVVLLGHHVEVRLHDYALAVLHAGRRSLAYVDVAGLVDPALQSVSRREVHDVLAYLLLVVRGAGYLRYFAEVLPHQRG